MDIASSLIVAGSIVVGLTGMGSAIAVIKYNVKGDIKSLKEKACATEGRVDVLEAKSKDTREFIIRWEERERHRDGRESKLVESFSAAMAVNEKIAGTMSELLNIDIKGLVRRIDCHDDEIESMATCIAANGSKK